MNAITIHVPDEIQERVRQIADAEGMSVEALLADYTAHMIESYEMRQRFLDMKALGETEVEKALELLRR